MFKGEVFGLECSKSVELISVLHPRQYQTGVLSWNYEVSVNISHVGSIDMGNQGPMLYTKYTRDGHWEHGAQSTGLQHERPNGGIVGFT